MIDVEIKCPFCGHDEVYEMDYEQGDFIDHDSKCFECREPYDVVSHMSYDAEAVKPKGVGEEGE